MIEQATSYYTNSSWCRWLLGTLLIVLWLMLTPDVAHAHGGVILDGDLTEEEEWLMAISPYPVTPGDTVITLLLYDLDTYAPINGLDAQLYLTPPSGDADRGPFELLTDPEQYPGDYSNILPLEQEGDWGVRFVVDMGDRVQEFTSQFTVQPGDANNPRPTVEGAADVAATATAFAQNVDAARQSGAPAASTPELMQAQATVAPAPTPSPTLAPAATAADDAPSTSAAPTWRNARVWMWGLLAIVPFALVFLWFLRSNDTEGEHQDNE